VRALLAIAGVALGGCLNATSEASFLGGRAEMLCDLAYPVCKGKFAGCQLDENHYIKGTFPGQRKFLVETVAGDWSIRVLFFLEDRLSPGTETEVRWSEPGCSDEYRYQLSKHKLAGDLFEQAGRDQVFGVEHAVVDYGDHLIEIYSDATCRYDVRVELVKNK
jgi:hypothetical protein